MKRKLCCYWNGCNWHWQDWIILYCMWLCRAKVVRVVNLQWASMTIAR